MDDKTTDMSGREQAIIRKRKNRRYRRIRAGIFGLVLLVAGIVLGKALFSSDSDTQNRSGAAQEEHQAGGAEGGSGAGTADEAWKLVLVNSTHPAQEGYEPVLEEVGNGEYFDARAADSLNEMMAAAESEGLSPLICSAYRSIELQTELYNNQVQLQMDAGLTYEEACKEAERVVAYPGTSEHTLGLAADIVSTGYQSLDDEQADTAEAKWLMENCGKFGFILRYPADKSDITGVIYEPWHYRYVGVRAAEEIMGSGLCLEEYLDRADQAARQ